MRKLVIIMAVAVTFVGCCGNKKSNNSPLKAEIINSNLKYNEGAVVYGDALLLSNFGSDELNPLNSEGKGYIVKMEGDKMDILIAADGNLSGPKGMAIKDNYLYIADVQKVVIYNLNNLSEAARIVAFPEGNMYVNDIAISGNSAYISVTNSGKLFTLDISDPETIDESKLSEYIDVVGANGLLIDGNSLYIASYPADGNTTSDNVIYKIENLSSPILTKLITREGQYDGLAIIDDKLYFSSWVNGEIGYINLADKSVTLLEISDYNFAGPADITYFNNKLYIPNLPASELVAIEVK